MALDPELHTPAYRSAYVRSVVNGTLASQVRALRRGRKLSQKQLADMTGMKQSRISALENAWSSNWNLETLRRVADALDVALTVHFQSFGDFLCEMNALSESSLNPPSWADDPMIRSLSRGEPDVASTTDLTTSTGAGDVLASASTGATALSFGATNAKADALGGR